MQIVIFALSAMPPYLKAIPMTQNALMPKPREPEPAIEQENLLSVDDIVRIVRRYSGLAQRMYNECICALVPCRACDVDVDEYCIGGRGREHPGSLHADRRFAAERWRKAHPKEWVDLKDGMFLHLVKMRKEGKI